MDQNNQKKWIKNLICSIFCWEKKIGNYNRKQKCIYGISVEGWLCSVLVCMCRSHNRIFIFGWKFIRSLFSVGVVMWKMIDFSTWMENISYAFEKYALSILVVFTFFHRNVCVKHDCISIGATCCAFVWETRCLARCLCISFVMGLRVINPSFFRCISDSNCSTNNKN